MSYLSYFKFNSLDFALDEYFQQWVKTPNAENCSYWDDFLKRFPEKTIAVNEAKNLIELMDFKRMTYEPTYGFKALFSRIKNSVTKKSSPTAIYDIGKHDKKNKLLISLKMLTLASIIAMLTYLFKMISDMT